VTSAVQSKGKPSVIVLDTVKGQGCAFAEKEFNNHHMRFTAEQIAAAVADCEKRLAELEG
jgi:transketolase